MIYKLQIGYKVYYAEEIGATPQSRIKFPMSFKKFNFWLWLKNPNVKIYRYINYKWELVCNWPYRVFI